MNTKERNKINFGNWVPGKMIIIPIMLGIACFGLGFIHWLFLFGSLVFLPIGIYFAIARHSFSAKGGNIQDQVQELLIQHINWNGSGKVLDIGCGNGPLSIKLAQRFPQAQITGLDYWGKSWDYSMQVCTNNIRLAGVEERISFKNGTASKLPFDDASFDLVVSNLTFHEVMDAKDKRQPIREVLRVLKPGGVFVLQDLFLLTPYFGIPDELVNTLREWGAADVEFIHTCEAPFIPTFVKLPFMLGTMAILRGKKYIQNHR